MSPTENEQTTTEGQTRENRQGRTVTFKDSYEELTPFSSISEPPRNEPSRLIGFQKDPKLKKRQREQQRTESRTTNAPIDLRDKLNDRKRDREQGDQSNTRGNSGVPTPSPSHPEARRQKETRELLTATEVNQLDITARDAVRLQREVPKTADEENPPRPKFESATSKGDYATQRTIEKANIRVLYTRPVKQPIFTNDGTPPWFERLRRDLQRDDSTYLQPLQTISEQLTRQRPGRFGENQLQTKNYARDPITLLPMGKDLLEKTRIALFVDSTIKSSYNANNTLMDVRLMNMPCTSLSKMTEVTDKMFTPEAAETIPLSPMLVYSNVIDHLALQRTLRYFDMQHNRFTEGFVTDEVVAYVETMSNIANRMRNKKPKTDTVFVSPPRVHTSPKSIATILVSGARSFLCKGLAFLYCSAKPQNQRDNMAPL